MPQHEAPNRRMFLRYAGVAGVWGALSPVASPEATASAASASIQAGAQYGFDATYHRIGTDCVRWDAQIALHGRDHIDVPMGSHGNRPARVERVRAIF